MKNIYAMYVASSSIISAFLLNISLDAAEIYHDIKVQCLCILEKTYNTCTCDSYEMIVAVRQKRCPDIPISLIKAQMTW